MSAGSFCRSPSEVTTTSPRAWSKPAEKAAVWPKLRRRQDHADRGVGLLELEERLAGAVGGAVVHEQDLVGTARGPEGLAQLPVQVVEVQDLVQEGDDDRDLGTRSLMADRV